MLIGRPLLQIRTVINNKHSATGANERIYYIRYYKTGKTIEEKAGRQHQDQMTPARADRAKLTIARLWEAFYDAKQENKSISDDRNCWGNYLLKDFGNKLPDQICTTDIDKLRHKLQDRGLAPGTVKQGLVLLKRILNFGTKRGLCQPINPAQLYFEMPKINNIKTKDLTAKQLSNLMTAIANEPDRSAASIMLMALYTGMRRGEIFKLEWNHIDFERGFILLRAPKGGLDQRIPLNNSARKVLEIQKSRSGKTDYVFPGKTNGPITDVRAPFIRIRKNAGLPKDFRPMHGLRHVFASTLASSEKVDLYTLQKLLTHRTPAMVQRYAHLRDDAMQRTGEVVGDMYQQMQKKAG